MHRGAETPQSTASTSGGTATPAVDNSGLISSDVINRFDPEPPCFVAGTMVLTESGKRPIETIRAGDWVATREQSGPDEPVQLRKVLETFQHINKATVQLVLRHPSGEFETIITTLEHPFYVRGDGWKRTADLEPGDSFYLVDGGVSTLVDISQGLGLKTVYNIEVEESHTYFVGKHGVWVHNYGGNVQASNQAQDLSGTLPFDRPGAGDPWYRVDMTHVGFQDTKLYSLLAQGVDLNTSQLQLVADQAADPRGKGSINLGSNPEIRAAVLLSGINENYSWNARGISDTLSGADLQQLNRALMSAQIPTPQGMLITNAYVAGTDLAESKAFLASQFQTVPDKALVGAVVNSMGAINPGAVMNDSVLWAKMADVASKIGRLPYLDALANKGYGPTPGQGLIGPSDAAAIDNWIINKFTQATSDPSQVNPVFKNAAIWQLAGLGTALVPWGTVFKGVGLAWDAATDAMSTWRAAADAFTPVADGMGMGAITGNAVARPANVWSLSPVARGRAIEDYLTQTEYAGWARTDHFINPNTGRPYPNNFPLIDFADFNTNSVVSLKTADTASPSFLRTTKGYVDELADQGPNITMGFNNANPSSIILDLRIPPGGMTPNVNSLIKYGLDNNVIVRVKEF